MNKSDHSQLPEWSRTGGGASEWRRELGELALACAGSFPAEEVQRLHELHRLLATAPVLVHGLAVPSCARLDQLIAAEACESAVLAMLGPDCGYLLSRGAGGQHLASVVLPGAAEETSAGGDSMALALVGALALALVEADGPAPSKPRKGQDGRLN